ncbi:hypothetical protein WMF26_26190 [Sorangium sp. So ce185]|uniref:hypothetical protein n=1 Tax=Sorangium sp. So ce185 TaxID=3133287 RepID=UPI003F61631D
MDIYGYDLDDHEWKAASDVAPVNGTWSATNGCQVRMHRSVDDPSRFYMFRVSAKAWHHVFGVSTFKPVTVELTGMP